VGGEKTKEKEGKGWKRPFSVRRVLLNRIRNLQNEINTVSVNGEGDGGDLSLRSEGRQRPD